MQTPRSSWSIGGNDLQRGVCFSPEAGLVTEELSEAGGGAVLIRPSDLRRDMAAEFSFRCNEKNYRGADRGFELLGAEESANALGRTLTVKLRHEHMPLDVAVVYTSFEGHPAIRKHLGLENRGAGELRMTHHSIESLGISLGPESETILNAQYGAISREILYTGRSEDAALLLANSRTGEGLAILSEMPGYMKRTEIGGWDETTRIRVRAMYDTDLMPFERTLKAGEQFTTAGVSLVAFRRGDGFRDPRRVLRSFAARVLVRSVDAHGLPWIYNIWEPFERAINQKIALELIEAAGRWGWTSLRSTMAGKRSTAAMSST